MNKFPKGSFEYENRHQLINALDESFPDRKNPMYCEVIRNAENHVDEFVKIAVREKYWSMYGIE